MKKSLYRPFAAGVAATVVAGVAFVAAPAAQAAGEALTVNPASGTANTLLSVTTNGGCPANSNAFLVQISGGDLPAGTNVNGYAPLSSVGATPGGTGNITVPLSSTLDGVRSDNGLASLATGAYTVSFVCLSDDPLDPLPVRTYPGTINITTAMTGTNAGAYSFQAAAAPAAVSLAASPSSVTAGGSSTVTATITPSNATGTVQFFVGGVADGAPVAVSGGTASKVLSNLTLGDKTVTASFTSTNTAIALSSTTNGQTTISVGSQSTTTTLTASPNPAYASSQIVLTANVSPATGGTVVFSGFPGGPSAPIAVVNGVATYPVGQLAPAAYSFSAEFTPNSAGATGSTGNASLTVLDKDPAQIATEFIRTTVADGALTITVKGFTAPAPTAATGDGASNVAYPYTAGQTATNVVFLPDAQLNASGTFIETSGNIIPVVVSDTRAGDLGYTVTGSITDLATTDGKVINGQNVGWAPYFLASNRWGGTPGNVPAQITQGAVVAPAAGVAPAAAGDEGIKGTPETLFGIAAGSSSGTVEYGAALSIKAPTYTLPGQYEGRLTITVNAL